MAVVDIGIRLHPSSDLYKVFEHLGTMLWMGIWVHPYTVMSMQVGDGF